MPIVVKKFAYFTVPLLWPYIYYKSLSSLVFHWLENVVPHFDRQFIFSTPLLLVKKRLEYIDPYYIQINSCVHKDTLKKMEFLIHDYSKTFVYYYYYFPSIFLIYCMQGSSFKLNNISLFLFVSKKNVFLMKEHFF